MTQPISEQIIDNIQSTIQAMTDADYNDNMGDVRRAEARPIQQMFVKFPAVEIMVNAANKIDTQDQYRECNLDVTLTIFTKTRKDLQQHLWTVAADIEKALGVDYNRNNLAIDTIIDSYQLQYVNPKEGDYTGAMDINLTVNYRHRQGDPFTA